MANVSDYIKNYGNISFKDKPFCDEDNVAMCMSFYMPLDKVVSPSFDDEPKPIGIASRELFAYRGGKHKPVGLVLVKAISELLMDMAARRRFSEVKVVACTDNFEKEPAVQFNAGTFLLPNGDIVVLFRGTDDTLTGWKEDLDILGSPNGIPSEKLSVEYLAEVAKRFDGDIIVCGHSKGGYVAQYAVLNSEKEVRDRIKYLYNNDGPGFKSYDYLGSDVYSELLPRYRHFIPQSSFIGMMLSHDDDYTVVKSVRQVGMMEHDLSTWQFKNGELKTARGLTNKGKVTDLVFHDVVSNLDGKQSAAFAKALNSIIEGVDQEGLMDVAKNLPASIKGGKAAYDALDDETKNALKEISEGVKKSVRSSVKTVITGNYTTVRERLEEESEETKE